MENFTSHNSVYISPSEIEGEKLVISVSIPIQIIAAVDLHFYDEDLGKPEYGARSRLIAKLLKKEIEKWKTQK